MNRRAFLKRVSAVCAAAAAGKWIAPMTKDMEGTRRPKLAGHPHLYASQGMKKVLADDLPSGLFTLGPGTIKLYSGAMPEPWEEADEGKCIAKIHFDEIRPKT